MNLALAKRLAVAETAFRLAQRRSPEEYRAALAALRAVEAQAQEVIRRTSEET